MLSAHKLRQKLGLSPGKFGRLLKQGLPCKGKGKKRQFDPAAVAAWLRQHGLIKPQTTAEQICTTRDEAARILGVSTRCFAEWLTDPSFPGKAGSPGRGDSYFPIASIRSWMLASGRGGQRAVPTDQELAAARRLKVQIDNDRSQVALEKELRSIGDTQEWGRFIARQVATAKALIGEAADKVESRLPAKANAELRATIRKAINEVMAETQNAIAELAAGDQDETEDVPDEV
jgi:hypothetical protein